MNSRKHTNETAKAGGLLVTHLMLLGPALFWGLSPMVMKIGLDRLAPFPYNTLRLLIGVAVAAPFMFLPGVWRPVPRRDILPLFAVPVLGFLGFQALFSIGVSDTSASVVAIILGTLPINVAVISRLFGLEKLSLPKALGVLATFLGVALIALGGGGFDGGGTYLRGVLLLVACEISYGFYTVYLKPVTRRYPTPQIVFIVMSVALIGFAAWSLLVEGPAVFRGIGTPVILSAVFSGVLALVVANILWSIGVNRLGSVNTSVYGNLPPVFGVAAGMLFLGERLTLLQFAGAAAVLAGIALVNRTGRRPR